MSTNVTNQSITELVSGFERTARIPALRGIVHSSMSQVIRWIRTDIFERAKKERSEEDILTGVDERLGEEEAVRAEERVSNAFGFETKKTPLETAAEFHKIYAWTKGELLTLAQNNVWDQPLEPHEMLEFMANNSQAPSMMVVKEIARIAGTNPETILKMQEIQAQRERDRLIKDTPEILNIFDGFDEKQGYENAVDELDAVSHHQLGVKVYESLLKAKNGILNRVLRSKKLSDLSAVPIIDDAAKQVEDWVHTFEEQNRTEMAKAIEEGRTVRTIEDVKDLF